MLLCTVISSLGRNCPVVVPTGVLSHVTGLDDSLDEVPDSHILMEECESVMEVECGDGEEDGVETKTDREEVRKWGCLKSE